MNKLCFLIFLVLWVRPALSSSQGSLEVYFYPPTFELDWSSPAELLHDFLDIYQASEREDEDLVTVPDGFGHNSSFNRHYYSNMGHTIGHISCTLPDGTFYEKWSSLSGQTDRKVDVNLALSGKGVGVLFHDFVDGHIINGEENVARLVYVKHTREVGGVERSGLPRYMRVNITSEQCRNLKDMVTFFEGFYYPPETTIVDLLKKPEEEVLYFTPNLDVYDSYRQRMDTGQGRVGGACSNYVVAMFKLIGFFPKTLEEQWTRRVEVSEFLIGSEEECEISGVMYRGAEGCRHVSSLLIWLRLNGNKWVYRGISNKLLVLNDPQMLWDFIGRIRVCLGEKDAFGAECTQDARNWIVENDVIIPDEVTLQHTHKGITTTRNIPGVEINLQSIE